MPEILYYLAWTYSLSDDEEDIQQAIDIFTLLIEEYPNSNRVRDSRNRMNVIS
jgi:outer membrane protein assembly factor BamD (BamD/ComL family)